MLCDRIWWNMFQIDVKVTWTMKIKVSITFYFDASIYSDKSVNPMLRFVNNNGLHIIKLCFNSRLRQTNLFGTELTQVPSYTQRTAQVS